MGLDIFLPFYGDVDYFKETVLSVINQDFSEWRLMIVNDAHPDHSVDDWVRSLNDSRISYFRNAENMGIAKVLTNCLTYSRTSHCVFLGSDDLLVSNFVSTIISLVKEHPDLNLIQPGVRVIDENGSVQSGMVDRIKSWLRSSVGSGFVPQRRWLATLLIGDWLYFPSLVWRTELVKGFGFDDRINVCADLDLALKVIGTPGRSLVLDDEIFLYRRHSQSDSSLKILNGIRFGEEKDLHYRLARSYWKAGERGLAILAAAHLTSRAHALLKVPAALKARRGLNHCLKHAFT